MNEIIEDRDNVVEIMGFGADCLKSQLRDWYDHIPEGSEKADRLAQIKIKLMAIVDDKTVSIRRIHFDALNEGLLPSFLATKINEFIISNKINNFVDVAQSNLKPGSAFEIRCKARAYSVGGNMISCQTSSMQPAPRA